MFRVYSLRIMIVCYGFLGNERYFYFFDLMILGRLDFLVCLVWEVGGGLESFVGGW